MDTELKQLQDRVASLEAILTSLTNAASIPADIQRALILSLSAVSSKSATSENKSVNEAGAASYSVLNPPDRFIRIGSHNVPAYD